MIDHSLADFVALEIEVLDPAAREDEFGIGLEFLAGVAFAQARSLVDGQLFLKDEQDHAHGGDDPAEDDDVDQVEFEFRVLGDPGKGLKDVERPSQEAGHAEEDARREAAEDVDDQHGGHHTIGAGGKGEGPSSSKDENHGDGQAAHHGAEEKAEPGGNGALLGAPCQGNKKGDGHQDLEEDKLRSDRLNAAENSVEENSVDHKRNGEGNDVKDFEAADAEAERGERGKKEGGTDLNGGFPSGSHPGMRGVAGEVPPDRRVMFDHAHQSQDKAQQPEQGADIAETPVKKPEGGQKKHRQDECGSVVVIGHRGRIFPSVLVGCRWNRFQYSTKVSGDLRVRARQSDCGESAGTQSILAVNRLSSGVRTRCALSCV